MINPERPATPTKMAARGLVIIGLAVALMVKYLGDVWGIWTVAGIWLLSGLAIFFTLPLEFFPRKPVEAAVSDQPSPIVERRRKKLPWLVRLVLTILLAPVILSNLSIRR